MDVSSWLRDLGLESYAHAFQANDINAEVLSRLTAEDLIAPSARLATGASCSTRSPSSVSRTARRSKKPRPRHAPPSGGS
jgi:hypothetical protein